MNKSSKRFTSLMIALLLTGSAFASPYFFADSEMDWQMLLGGTGANFIEPADPAVWADFEAQRQANYREGEFPPPSSVFMNPDLLVFPGDPSDPNTPDDAGLIMAWGNEDMPEGDYSSGYSVVYGVDPDLTNCTIKLSVHPPTAITMVAFGLTDAAGNQCSWTWYTGAQILPSPPGPPTTITINTNDIPGLGVNSSSPACATFSYNPAFDITQVVSIFINETFHNTPGVFPPPVPGGGSQSFYWNAWDNIEVLPNNAKAYKGSFVKYSQPPEIIDPNDADNTVPRIYGWDVKSVLPWYFDNTMLADIAADDWLCYDERPVTDLHWWGSFIGWTQPYPPPQVPDYFYMCIWKDVPAGAGQDWSAPKDLLWEHKCYKWVWNFAGYDIDPRWEFDPDYNKELYGEPQRNEACFQFNQLLSEDEYFYQEPMEEDRPNVYWLSIAAVYENTPIEQIEYPWGWKTKPFDKENAPDAAGLIRYLDQATGPLPWTPASSYVTQFLPIILPDPSIYPDGQWFDLAFELTTNEQAACHALSADLDHSCKVDLADLSLFAAQWLMVE